MANILALIGDTPLLALLAARVLLCMKGAGEKRHTQGMGCWSRLTISRIEFVNLQDAT